MGQKTKRKRARTAAVADAVLAARKAAESQAAQAPPDPAPAGGAPLSLAIAVAASKRKPRATATPREDILETLLDRGRLSQKEYDAAAWYRSVWRGAREAGDVPIRISNLQGAGGGGVGGAEYEITGARNAWALDCRAHLERAAAAVHEDEYMMTLLDLVCGMGVRLREITEDQRETEQLETTLRNALTMVGRAIRPDLWRIARSRQETNPPPPIPPPDPPAAQKKPVARII